MVCCVSKDGHVAIVLERTKRSTRFITTIRKKRKLSVERNVDFDKYYQLTGYDPADVAVKWLASPLFMTREVREELQMLVALKKNVVVAKVEDVAQVPAGCEAIGSAEDLNGRSLKSLTALFNKINPPAEGTEVAKFETVELATVAVWGALEAYVVPEKAVRAKKDPSEKQMRSVKGPISKASIITVVVESNPKREGTKGAEAFSKYKTGQTVAEFVAAGGSMADVRWDLAHNFISLEHVEEPKPEAPAPAEGEAPKKKGKKKADAPAAEGTEGEQKGE